MGQVYLPNASTVTGDAETHHKIAGKLFAILRWLPMLGANTVEPKQPEARAQPDVAVSRLRNRADLALRESIANQPRRVSVLTHVKGRVQRKCGRTQEQQA